MTELKTAKKVPCISTLVALGVALFTLEGCNGGDNSGHKPAADISGVWNGTNSLGENISFMFVQTANGLTGTASFLGPINGRLSHRTLSIEGSDLKGILSNDNSTIRGSYTDAGGVAVNFAVAREGGPAPSVVETPRNGDDGMPDGDGGDANGADANGAGNGDGDEGDGGDDSPPMP